MTRYFRKGSKISKYYYHCTFPSEDTSRTSWAEDNSGDSDNASYSTAIVTRRDQAAEVSVLFWSYRVTDYAYSDNGS
jgi:hypothetical protein